MSKNKWTILPFIVIASLILAVVYVVSLRKPTTPAEPLKAIPLSAAFIIKINDFNALYEKATPNNNLWNELKKIPEFGIFSSQLQYLDSLYHNVPEVGDLLRQGPSFLSAHATGRDRIGIMHILKVSPRLGEKKITAVIAGLSKGTLSERTYEGVTIHEAAVAGQKPLCWAVSRDLLMISFSSILIEDAVRQLGSGESVMNLKGFSEIYGTKGKNVIANVFVNFQRFPQLLSSFVLPDYRPAVRSLSGFAGWAAMDVNLLSDMLLMNGFVDPPDSLTSMASLFTGQTPQKITAGEILPGSVASFLSLTMSDPAQYIDAYRSYLKDHGRLTAYNNALKSLTQTYQTDFLQEFIAILDNEITLAFDGNNEGNHAVYVLMRLKSQGQAESMLNKLMADISAATSKPLSSFVENYKLDNEVSFTIRHLPIPNLTAKLFGNLFAPLNEHYVALVDNYLVFASAAESLKSLIHSHVLNKTLESEAAYKDFKNNLSPRSNILLYYNLSKGQPVVQWLKPALAKRLEASSPVFQKVQVMGFQLYSNNKLLYNNFLVKYLPDFSKETQTVWESRLDTLALGKPVFVMNHQTMQNEVFVQDAANNVYLINQVGRILWKVSLPGPINSEIFQIDYFRNGKLQLLFSTRDYLYLIDRNGNFVEKYPVKLRSPSTCGVAVFDYEKNRDYRLFIACDDNKVYAYTKEGALVTGWSFEGSESTVAQPVNHFRVGDKDFLVFGDRFRTYILDRKGNTRITPDTFFPHSAANNYSLHLPRDGSAPAFVSTDTAGQVRFVYFNGEVKIRSVGTFSNRHYFDYKDLNGDGNAELIFLDRNTLSVFSNNATPLFSYRFNESIDTRPLFYQFSATDRKLGVVSHKENLIYLFNNDGKLYSGFPLQGNTPFSIGNFGDSISRFNLVVGSRDNFLYNYRVR